MIYSTQYIQYLLKVYCNFIWNQIKKRNDYVVPFLFLNNYIPNLSSIYQAALTRRHAYSGGYDYNGYAVSGSAEGSLVWTITRILNNADGTTTVTHCYTCSWTNYLTNIYI